MRYFCENWTRVLDLCYGLLSILDPSGPKLVFSFQTPRLRYFLRFDNFVGFNISFWTNRGLEDWSQGSWLVTWWNSWTEIAKNYFLGPRPLNVTVLGSNIFHIKFHKILHKTNLDLQNLDDFSWSHMCLFPENFQKIIKNTLYEDILDV